MPSLVELKDHRDAILACAERNGAFFVRVFGSVSRGEQKTNSDVDFLVRFEPERSLLDHAGLIEDLGMLLGVHVDVVDEGGLSPYLRDAVLHDAVPL